MSVIEVEHLSNACGSAVAVDDITFSVGCNCARSAGRRDCTERTGRGAVRSQPPDQVGSDAVKSRSLAIR
jgi:hypothetical protein